MAINLAKQLPSSSKLYLNDVVAAAVDEVEQACASLPVTVAKCTNAKEVAERSVRIVDLPLYARARVCVCIRRILTNPCLVNRT